MELSFKRIAAILSTAVFLSGCSYTMQLMPRDGGQIYMGQVKSNGGGSGTLSVNLGDRTCTGNFVQSASGDSFGLIQTFGARGATVSTVASTGVAQYKALMTCSDGSGLRCDVTGEATGSGICVDSRNRVYDMMYK